MGKAAYIFGHGGHARVIASMISGTYSELVNVRQEKGDGWLSEETFFLNAEKYADADIFIGIGDNRARRRVYEKLRGAGLSVKNCISSHAFIAPTAELMDGVVVCPGAVVMAGARVGRNVIINTLSGIDHDCVIGDHSQITAGVSLGGGTEIGDNCFLGIKSATVPGIKIGNDVVVMAGSLVTRNVESGLVVGGYPAIVIKQSGVHEHRA